MTDAVKNDGMRRFVAKLFEQLVDAFLVAFRLGNASHRLAKMRRQRAVEKERAQPLLVEQLEAVLLGIRQYPEMLAAVDDVHGFASGALLPVPLKRPGTICPK